ncbi:hypothetical protein IWX49DRAFT_591616 [Phyllosticta citricarpa]
MSSPSLYEDDFASAFERFTPSRSASSIHDAPSTDNLTPILRRIANGIFERQPASPTRSDDTSSPDQSSHYELAAEELIPDETTFNHCTSVVDHEHTNDTSTIQDDTSTIQDDTSTIQDTHNMSPVNKSCEHAKLYPNPDVDYKAEARALVNNILRDPRLEQADIQVLLEHIPQILSRGRSHLEAAYLHHKLSAMAEDIGLVLASTTNRPKTSRPALLRSLANHLLGMMNLFAMSMEPITIKPIDLAMLCPCNACGHACQIPGCTAPQHVCVAIGLAAKDSVALGLGAGVRDMPPPTICPGSCRLPHGLRAVDVICEPFLDGPVADHDPGCVLGHDQAALRRAVLEEHRRFCPVVSKTAPVEEEEEEEEGEELEQTTSGSGSQENARPVQAEGSRKRSLWNLRAFRK